jgi:hypothetical protein
MDDVRVELRLEVVPLQEPVTGVVHAPDGAEHEFSGWSELFGVLQSLLMDGR